MADICEICEKEFSIGNPRCRIENHILCRSCKNKVTNYSSVEEGIEKEKIKFNERILEEQKKQKEREEHDKYISEAFSEYWIEYGLKSKVSFDDYLLKYEAKRNYLNHIWEDTQNKGYNFSIKKIYRLCCIAADSEKKKILIKNIYDDEYKIYDFSDILSFDLEQDGSKLIEGKSNSALAGGLLFGTAGAVVGASGKRDIKEYCESLVLSIIINDPLNFQVRITFINGYVDKNSQNYRERINIAKEMVAILQLATKSCEKLPTKEENTVLSNVNEAVEAIKKYKELLDIGAITQEEFEEKKKQLL